VVTPADVLSLDTGPSAGGALTEAVTPDATRAIQLKRLTVLGIDRSARRLLSITGSGRILRADVSNGAVVVMEDRKTTDLALVKPGDVITVEPSGGPIRRIVVLRQAWQDMASPEQ
jgi:hypothetical protein